MTLVPVSPTDSSPTAGEMAEGVAMATAKGGVNFVMDRLNSDFGVGIGRSVLQGMTFGFGDEIEAGLRSLGGEEYSVIRDKIRADIEQFRDEETAFAYGTEIATALLTPGGLAKVLTMAAPKAAKAAGSMLPSAAKTRTGKAFAGGGAYGAGTADTSEMEDIAMSVAMGGAFGLGGQMLGEPVGKGVRALGRKLPLTPGQMAGGFANKVEQALSSVPGIGGGVSKMRGASLQAFPAMMYNRALKPLGKTIDPKLDARKAFIQTKNIIDNEYDQVLEGIDVPFGGSALDDLQAVVNRAKKNLGEVGKAEAADFETLVLDRVISAAADNGDVLSGKALKEISSDIREMSRQEIAKKNFKLADAYSDMDATLLGLFAKQAPSAATRLKKLDRAYANYVPLRNAAAKADDSMFTPAQALSAARSESGKLGAAGKSSLAAGQGRMQPLLELSKRTLGTTLPDSGTALRQTMTSAAAGLAGGGVTTGAMSPLEAAALFGGGVLGRAAYTEPGLRFVVNPSLRAAGAAARSPATAGLLAERSSPSAREFLLGPSYP